MMFLGKLFDTSDFVPRWSCGSWPPYLGWLHIVSDVAIFVAYFAIPLSLAVVLVRRRDFPFPRVIALFVAFILSCGLTHLTDAVMFYEPVYRFSGAMRVITALVSLLAAVVLIRALPAVLSTPSIQKKNEELTEALGRERVLLAELGSARDQLEKRSADLTARTRRASEALASIRTVACRWEADTGRIAWEIGFGESARLAGLAGAQKFESWSSLLGESGWEALRRACESALAGDESLLFESAVSGEAGGGRIRLAATADPASQGQPRSFTGMFRFV